MGKFTGASGSEWKMIAASGNGVWGQRQRLAMSYGGYNRLELVPRISSFRLVPDGSAAAGITGSRPAGLRTRRVLPVPSVGAFAGPSLFAHCDIHSSEVVDHSGEAHLYDRAADRGASNHCILEKPVR